MKNDLKLSSVKLNNGGLKGLVVKYSSTQMKDGRYFHNGDTSTRKYPIHSDLENCFSWLKSHILDICNYPKTGDERTDSMNNLAITQVDCISGEFIIHGELTVLNGTKTLKLKTPKVTEESYSNYKEAMAIIDGVFAETKDYLAGKKEVSDVQLVLNYNQKNTEFDKALFGRLTVTEQKEMATKILEDMGAIVFMNDEEEMIEETTTEIVSTPTKEVTPEWEEWATTETPSSIVIDSDVDEVPLKQKSKMPPLKEDETIKVEKFSDGSFKVILPEVNIPQSTAKRI